MASGAAGAWRRQRLLGAAQDVKQTDLPRMSSRGILRVWMLSSPVASGSSPHRGSMGEDQIIERSRECATVPSPELAASIFDSPSVSACLASRSQRG
jgi:hypothetical protein